ncbi:phage tail family protein [Paenibacillus taichungensis]|uniref:phage tail family protein n=1 Tax=Paenibacillus taichungensis TaxID=484184 RepID=UPI002DBF4343|nr:phage tail family protein [Paenibacillus taichungensis]MEC0110401.1 phage tail family protein [Paenibacillus taichungensis]MEC0200077.1 phage tail family protein [Paenibacillus taichungensis]
METVTFTNSRGESLYLGTSKPFYLERISGTGGVPADLLSTKSPYQDGSSFVGMMLSNRPINVVGGIVAKTRQQMFQYRRDFMRVLNPKLGLGTLVYTNSARSYSIKAVAEGTPEFDERIVSNQPFTINFICPDPYFTDVSQISKGLRFEEGGMMFPLRLPTQFAFASFRGIFQNDGDVPTPVEIHYKGPALNPVVTNETTGEYIKINYDLGENDVLEINTAFGKKRVEVVNLDGTRTNVFHWIDLGSTFFQLDVGQNSLVYDSDREGDRAIANVTIFWNNRYGGG